MPIFMDEPGAAEEHIPLPESSDDDDSSSELSGYDHKLNSDLEVTESDSENSFYDSDEEAPEALSFKTSRETVLSHRKEIIEILEKHKEKKRKKRKEIHDQFMQETKEKRQKIDSKLLPEDVIEELDDQPGLEAASYEAKDISSDDEEEKEEVGANAVNEETAEENLPILFKCKSLAEEHKARKNELRNFKTLKDRLLYGGHIRREKSSKDADAKRKKQLIRGSTGQ